MKSWWAMAATAALAVALAAPVAAQEPAKSKSTAKAAKTAKTAKATPALKVGKDQKVCRYTFPSGQKRTWVCKREEPCCAWDAFHYVKCGSTITGCL